MRKNIGLYRGQTIKGREWVEGFFALFNSIPFIGAPNSYGTMLWFEVDSRTVGEFTGMFDQYGKKIFEEDIISTPNGTVSNTGMGIVCFYKGMWVCLYNNYNNDACEERFDELYTVCNEREIVGNVHDDIELLSIGEDDGDEE